MNEPASQTPTSPTGILVIDKGVGPTSMRVCAAIRARLRRGGAPKRVKVGHAGTLDPLATGVLVILVGKATKLCDRVMAGEKEYVAVIDLSQRSTTDDAEGELTAVETPIPPTRAEVEAGAARFVGRIEQVPPAFSALHIDGQRAYDLARRGKVVELKARPIDVHSFRVDSYVWPLATVTIRCGKGTYIRSLARDLGAALGVGGMLAGLRRTRVGEFSISQARTLADLPEVMGQSDLDPIPGP
ncbi:tRNA pseudouridine synthase B [Phycisphaerales bacterium]|nr:tRNA pseudouridine synthase B [Phycisphaerales bacterium]